MGRPSKPMAKNSNSKFTTRNNKQDIFSRFEKISKPKEELQKATTDASIPEADKPES